MTDFVCSYCGASASYDGRCGDGPYLTCGHQSQPSSSGGGDYGGRGDTYTQGPGSPVPRESYEWPEPSRESHLETENRRLREELRDRKLEDENAQLRKQLAKKKRK